MVVELLQRRYYKVFPLFAYVQIFQYLEIPLLFLVSEHDKRGAWIAVDQLNILLEGLAARSVVEENNPMMWAGLLMFLHLGIKLFTYSSVNSTVFMVKDDWYYTRSILNVTINYVVIATLYLRPTKGQNA